MHLVMPGPEPDVRFATKFIKQSHLGEGEGEFLFTVFTLHDPVWTF